MSRNYGWGSRDMVSAARVALKDGVGRKEFSYSTAATLGQRFAQFVMYAKSAGVGRMERIGRELVVQYGRGLADKVRVGELKPAYVHNLISAVNSVLSKASRGQWEPVYAVKDCGVPTRSAIRDIPTPGYAQSMSAIDAMRGAGMERQAALAELAKELGLRSKEASLLNAHAAYAQAISSGTVSITDGTKGGLTREINISNERQIETLMHAAEVQGDARSIMPANQNWKEWREGDLRAGREVLKEFGITGYHDLRAEYASERYEEITGHAAPCNSGEIVDKQADREAREVIADELGHNRTDVTNEYLGGRK